METLIAAVGEAGGRKYTGQGEWIACTADLTVETREAIRTLRKLQVIVANCYRPNHDLTAGWNAATHIERAPKRTAASADSPPPAPTEIHPFATEDFSIPTLHPGSPEPTLPATDRNPE
jgi:hypothetical protein